MRRRCLEEEIGKPCPAGNHTPTNSAAPLSTNQPPNHFSLFKPSLPMQKCFAGTPHRHQHRMPIETTLSSPSFSEWKGRCFRCCSRGHTAAQCINPKKCGRCWEEGHIGAYCKKVIFNPAARSYWPVNTVKPKLQQGEPPFDELIIGDYPQVPKPLPEGRPEILYCYVEKDIEFNTEIEKLEGAVIMSAHNLECNPTIDQIA